MVEPGIHFQKEDCYEAVSWEAYILAANIHDIDKCELKSATIEYFMCTYPRTIFTSTKGYIMKSIKGYVINNGSGKL